MKIFKSTKANEGGNGILPTFEINPLEIRVGEEYSLNIGIILTNWNRERGKAIRSDREKVTVIKVREEMGFGSRDSKEKILKRKKHWMLYETEMVGKGGGRLQ